MKWNLSKMMFLSSMITGTTITISSKTWIMMWIGLEMNLLSFIPLMAQNKNPYETEASMKYFMTQAMASMIMLMALILSDMKMETEIPKMMMLTAIFIKMGAAPFHMWFPSVMQGLSWMNCLLLMTWQKIAPMIMTSYLMSTGLLSNLIIILSVLVGAGGGFNQTSIRKMMAYSSISHIGWLLTALIMSMTFWLIYFLIYTLMNIAVIAMMMQNKIYHLKQIFSMKMNNNVKLAMFTSILSLGGLPPFLGFLPKWMIIQNSMTSDNKINIMIMIMTTMVTLYFYLRMTYSAFTLNSQLTSWTNSNFNKNSTMMTTIISMMGIPFIVMISLY
uniref:NADH-ubiquinone oxidoreductase chain 2 n=1 Tax=Agriocnemis femina TaxID=1168618 RepID=A0A6C0R3P6_9ODON|nr:NADH dehydrogenase subunit 2 [Agriocnemis femina]